MQWTMANIDSQWKVMTGQMFNYVVGEPKFGQKLVLETLPFL